MTITLQSSWPSGAKVSATFSDDMTHRYSLTHTVPGNFLHQISEDILLYCMLNPSVATHERSDATLRRCAGFASRFGYDRFQVVNLFSFRSTSPKVLTKGADVEGDPENLEHILDAAANAREIVCAWGVWGVTRGRANYVLRELRAHGHGEELRCLGVTQKGAPLHPLYQPSSVLLIPYEIIP